MSTPTTSDATAVPRITKRKLDDAISLLDSAVQEKGYGDSAPSSVNSASPPSAKRRALSVKSIYATLSKYGFRSTKDVPSPEKTGSLRTPRLTALLDKSKTAPANPGGPKRPTISSPQALHSRPPFRPTSVPDFLARLGTFKLTTYRDKPRATDAVFAARCGWKNDGVDRLVCESCSATWVVGSTVGMSREAANTLTERHRVGMVMSHKDSCPWRTRQCDESIYRVPLKGSTVMAKEIRDTAVMLTPLVKDVNLKHPLTSPQVAHLESTIASLPTALSVTLADDSASSPPPTAPALSIPPSPTTPSETALVLALFGWSLSSASTSSPNALTFARDKHSTSLHRSATTSSHHRTSSGGAPAPSGPPRTPSTGSLGARSPRARPTSYDGSSPGGAAFHWEESGGLREDTVVSCTLCQRRVGLWGFSSSASIASGRTSHTRIQGRTSSGSSGATASSANSRPKSTLSAVSPAQSQSQPHATPPMPTIQIVQPPAKPLDVVKEHRSYCPYIVRSTPLPTFSFAMTSAATQGASGTGTSAPSGSSPAHRVVSLPPTPVSILSRPLSRVSTSGGTPTPGTPTGTGEEETLTEGWRAVLSVVGRAGMGRRRRRKRSGLLGMEMQIASASVQEEERNQASGSLEQVASASGEGQRGASVDAATMEEDESERHVDAMVESVKRGGGKELLRYVKGLLG